MACRYCDFAAPIGRPRDGPETARDAIDAYLELLGSRGRRAELHFFGGEPFDAEEVVHFAVEYAKLRAAELGMRSASRSRRMASSVGPAPLDR